MNFKQWKETFMSTSFHGLYVDDIRDLPKKFGSGWCSARSFHEAILKLELIDFDEVSLDHDIASFYGNKEMTGYDILLWMVQRKMDGKHVPTTIHVHSANPVGVERMEGVIKRYLSA